MVMMLVVLIGVNVVNFFIIFMNIMSVIKRMLVICLIELVLVSVRGMVFLLLDLKIKILEESYLVLKSLYVVVWWKVSFMNCYEVYYNKCFQQCCNFCIYILVFLDVRLIQKVFKRLIKKVGKINLKKKLFIVNDFRNVCLFFCLGILQLKNMEGFK